MRKHISMLLVIMGILCLGVGYSSLSTSLLISGEAKVNLLSIKDRILNDNGGIDYIESRGIPNLSIVATINEGMFSTLDNDNFNESKVNKTITDKIKKINFNELNNDNTLEFEYYYLNYNLDNPRIKNINMEDYIKDLIYKSNLLYADLIMLLINNWNFPKKIEKIVDEPVMLKEFDKETFDSIIERIIIGEVDENGNSNSDTVRFILKTGEEYKCENNGIDTSVSFGSYKRLGKAL